MSGVALPVPATAAPSGNRSDALSRIRDRLVVPMPNDGWLGWVLPLLVTAFGGALRFWHLTRPAGATLKGNSGLVFDEVYYAHDSFSLLHYGVETSTTGCQSGAHICAAFVAHPPLGKWMIAVGEWLFDHNHSIVLKGGVYPSDTLSFRISAAVIGTLSILLIARIARRLFRSTLLGCVAGLLLSLDGLEFVQSRLSLLDIFLMFWVLAAFGALLIDRDHTRRKLASRLQAPLLDGQWGPGLGWRPWRWAAGLCAGASVAVKWSGAYYIVAWLILAILWDLQARRSCYEGARGGPGRGSAWRAMLAKDATYSLLPLVFFPAILYVASWTGWFMAGTPYSYDYNYVGDAALAHARGLSYVWDVFRGWWHYQDQIWQFSKTLDKGHPYRSRPWGWLLMSRPIAYFYGSPPSSICGASTCSQEVMAIGNPAIWWASIGALIAMGWRWLGRRDWRGLAVLLPFLAGYLPWCFFDISTVAGSDLHRTMFFYYMVPEVPFMVLAVTFAVGIVIGPRVAPSLALSDRHRPGAKRPRWTPRRTGRLVAGGSYLALVVALFVYFYPILAAEPIPYNAYRDRLWFSQCSNVPPHFNKDKTQENGPCWF